ncbi:hypothetical protein Bca4012_076066 [Brassica carinata]|nr:PREDICTED: uncharacterized protein LOC106304284 [Brassica oleracea var. oleracea]XP_013746582.1 uncharacterized protein BNAC07G05230D [Brassica napus]CAF1956209.1 unnamed protein product [Brassica napus]VDD35661.1 unnamed protein product [Brassica oleracea]
MKLVRLIKAGSNSITIHSLSLDRKSNFSSEREHRPREEHPKKKKTPLMEKEAAEISTELNFDSTTSSPYITAPSSPTLFGNNNAFFFSAPTSPSPSTSSNIPFDWSDQPRTPKKRSASDIDDDFEFNFSGQLDKSFFSAADELFDGGKIRPLGPSLPPVVSCVLDREDYGRGRDRSPGSSTSPLRVSDIMVDEEEVHETTQMVASNTSNQKSSVFLSAILFPGRAYKKWKLKDLLLFRSASDGRPVPTKESLRRYDILTKKEAEEIKSSSIRSRESCESSVSRSRRRHGTVVSAHEMHYTENRAVSEELKRKTFLPYKQGWLGCLGFNPAVHEISRVGSLSRAASS